MIDFLLPGGHEEHGLALEVLHVLVAEGFAVVVLEDLEAVGGLELAIVERLEAHAAADPEERQQQEQFNNIPSHLNYIFYTWQSR